MVVAPPSPRHRMQHERQEAALGLRRLCIGQSAWQSMTVSRKGSTAVAFPPPLALSKAFSRSGCRRIFPLFSRVMREGLSTALASGWPGSGLSGPVFSGPHDCHIPVSSIYAIDFHEVSEDPPEHFDFGAIREMEQKSKVAGHLFAFMSLDCGTGRTGQSKVCALAQSPFKILWRQQRPFN
jgi:hypothetical protein